VEQDSQHGAHAGLIFLHRTGLDRVFGGSRVGVDATFTCRTSLPLWMDISSHIQQARQHLAAAGLVEHLYKSKQLNTHILGIPLRFHTCKTNTVVDLYLLLASLLNKT